MSTNDLASQVLNEFLQKINAIPGLEDHAFMVYTDEGVGKLQTFTKPPAIAMMYGGLLQQSNKSGTGMNPWLYVDLFIFPNLERICESPTIAVTDDILGYLADLREHLKFQTAHCARTWEFVTEVPTEVNVSKDCDLFAYHQRWRVELHLFNQR